MRETRERELRWYLVSSLFMHGFFFVVFGFVNIEPPAKPGPTIQVKLVGPEGLNEPEEPKVIKKQKSEGIIEEPKFKPYEPQQQPDPVLPWKESLEGMDPSTNPLTPYGEPQAKESRTSSVVQTALKPLNALSVDSKPKPPLSQPPGQVLDKLPLLSYEESSNGKGEGSVPPFKGIPEQRTKKGGGPENSSQGSAGAEKIKNRTSPELLNPIPPSFPPIGGVERCTVIVEMWVETDGRPSGITCYREPEVDEEKKQAFIQEALKVAKQYLFKPALSDGKPIRTQIRIPIRFGTVDTFAKIH